MKHIEIAKVLENKKIQDNIYDMWLEAKEIPRLAKAGQFIEVYVAKGENLLPRPISICEIEGNKLRIVFQVVGVGTEFFSTLKAGDTVKILGSIGNGFSITQEENIVLVGGGIGVPPLLELAKALRGKNLTVFLGFRNFTILADEFEKLGAKVYIATDDGSYGFKGNIIELMNNTEFKADKIYSCGPKIMLKHLANYAYDKNISCEISMEERMACGIGACVGCVVKIKENNEDGFIYKKVCVDGPVFDSREVIFND